MSDLDEARVIIGDLVRLVELQASKGVLFTPDDLDAALKPARDFLSRFGATSESEK